MLNNDAGSQSKGIETEVVNQETILMALAATAALESESDNETRCYGPSIHALPDELLLKIFRYLSLPDLGLSVAIVCQRWHALAMDPSLWWADFRFSFKPAEEILTILAAVPWMRRISLPDRCVPLILAPITSWCSNLSYFDVGLLHERTEKIHVIEMAFNATSVTHLHISSPLIDLEMVELLTSYMVNLKSIDFSFCDRLCDDCVDTITKNVNLLHLINVNGCEQVSDIGIENLIKSFSQTLHHIFLDGFYLSPKSLIHLRDCFNLRTLSITYASSVDDSCVYSELRHVNELIARRSKNALSHDYLIDFFTNTISYNNFVYIDLTDCEQMDDEVVKIMSERCKNVRCIVLAWCCSLTERSLADILNNCSKLVSLNMYGNYGIDGQSLLELNLNSVLPFLMVLDFTSCDNVKEDLLKEVFLRYSSVYLFDYLGDCVGHDDISHYNIWKLQYRGTQPSSFREKLKTSVGVKNFNMFLESFRC